MQFIPSLLNRLVLPVFLLVLLVPATLGILRPTEDVLEDENRRAAAFPGLPGDIAEMRKIPGQIEDYTADRFGLRAQMIWLWEALKRQINGKSSDRVLAGSDGWLFLTDLNVVDRSAGRFISEEGVAEVLATMMDIQDRSAKIGASPVFLAAPNKHAIHRDALPDFARGAPEQTTELDRLIDNAAAAGIDVLDPRPVLRAEAAADRPVFRLGDTHWNSYGAAFAFDQVVTAWEQPTWRFDPGARLTGYETVVIDGDLVRFANLSGQFADQMPQLDLAGWPAVEEVTREAFDLDYDQPSYVVDYGRAGPTILVIGDSFTRDIFPPYLGAVAGRLIWIHHRNGNFDRNIFERELIDYVLFEFLQRQIPVWQDGSGAAE